MTKTLSIKWKADRQDPDTMTMYGIEFPAGQFVSVPADHPQIERLKGNQWFEVSEGEQSYEAPDPVAGPYSVQRKGNGKGRPSTYVIVSEGVPPSEDEYSDEEIAQSVCSALNSSLVS